MSYKGIFDNVLTDYLYETAKDGIVANPGGGQANATPITAQTARVTTVATAGDSIKLPTSAPGLELLVINSGANPVQVFGSGPDTIDGIASATGVSQMPNSLVIYTCASAGAWFSEGLATGFGGPGLQTQSFANNLTATGSTQGTALVLSSMINRVTTAAAGTGVALPASVAGLMITVTNRGANPLTVYGAGADQINGVGSVVMPPNSTALFVAAVAGQWECEGVGAGFSGGYPTVSATNGITAAGTTQGTAAALPSVMNRITTAAVGTGVVLPTSAAGMQVIVYNAGANSVSVYPAGTDTVNSGAAGAAFAVAAGKNATFGCPVAGAWHAILSA